MWLFPVGAGEGRRSSSVPSVTSAYPRRSAGILTADKARMVKPPASKSNRRIRILAMLDEFTRACLALVVDTSPACARVCERDTIVAAMPDKPTTD